MAGGMPFKVPPLQLSPAPSATSLDLRSLAGGGGASPGSPDAVTTREASFSCLAARLGAEPPPGVPSLALQSAIAPSGLAFLLVGKWMR